MLVQIGRRNAPTGSYQSLSSDAFRSAQARSVAAGRPMFAHLYVENRCHLKCQHCYETEDTFPHEKEHALSLSDYARIFDELAGLGVLVVTLSGGEVFLRRDFLDIVELARKKRFAVRIYTSGTLIDEEKADRLKALQVSEIHISVYSPDPAVHDAFTGIPRSWEKSTRALKMLRERGLRTVLKANVLTINVDALEGLLALAQDLDADYQLDPTVKPKMNGDTSALRYAVSPEVLAQKVLSRPELHKFVSLEEAEGICDGQNPRTGGGGMCAAAMGLITVHADGGVSPCALFPVSGGNARSERIEDIWKSSPLFETVRNQTFAGMTSCSSCSVQAGCSPCMAYALVEHGDHRACNASSLQYAQATAEHARLLKRAHEKNSAGHPLPLVGDATVPDLDPERSSKRPLSSETG